MVDINEKLLDFLHKSPTCFHAIDEIKKVLVKQGYRELSEADSWNLEIDGIYFTVRNQSRSLRSVFLQQTIRDI